MLGSIAWPLRVSVVSTGAPPLVDQLKIGGRLVIPVGDFFQDLLVLTKTDEGVEQRKVIPVRFVPMIGEIEDQKD